MWDVDEMCKGRNLEDSLSSFAAIVLEDKGALVWAIGICGFWRWLYLQKNVFSNVLVSVFMLGSYVTTIYSWVLSVLTESV